jgi:hypothetical protein
MTQHRVPDSLGNPTRWEVITQGLAQFIQAPAAVGVGVGIQFFPQPPPPGDLTNPVSCLTADYTTPSVEIGLLPGNAAALTTSIQGQLLGDVTPSYPALEGALTHAQAWATTHPFRATAVVYVTDGFPTICAPGDPGQPASIPQLVVLASSYANSTGGSPGIPTFVVGVGVGTGDALAPNLDAIANAGGTGRAHLVASAAAVDDLAQDLLRIASSPIWCETDLPAWPGGGPIDPALINLRFTPSGSSAEVVGRVAGASACATIGGGWYYDNPSAPTKIDFCPSTCSLLHGGVLETLVGCATVNLY